MNDPPDPYFVAGISTATGIYPSLVLGLYGQGLPIEEATGIAGAICLGILQLIAVLRGSNDPDGPNGPDGSPRPPQLVLA